MTVKEIQDAFILAGDRNITFLLDNNFTACSRSEETVMFLDIVDNNLIYIRPGITTNPAVPMEFMAIGFESIQGYRIEMTMEEAIKYIEDSTFTPQVGTKEDKIAELRKSSMMANQNFTPSTAKPAREAGDTTTRLVDERASLEDYTVIKH